MLNVGCLSCLPLTAKTKKMRPQKVIDDWKMLHDAANDVRVRLGMESVHTVLSQR